MFADQASVIKGKTATQSSGKPSQAGEEARRKAALQTEICANERSTLKHAYAGVLKRAQPPITLKTRKNEGTYRKLSGCGDPCVDRPLWYLGTTDGSARNRLAQHYRYGDDQARADSDLRTSVQRDSSARQEKGT